MAPSWTLESNLPNTLDRIHRFASLTGGQDLATVFLLNPPKTSSFISVKDLTSAGSDPEAGTKGVLAYAKLQASLLSRSDIPHIPSTSDKIRDSNLAHAAACTSLHNTLRDAAALYDRTANGQTDRLLRYGLLH
jgi:hypothetical protein